MNDSRPQPLNVRRLVVVSVLILAAIVAMLIWAQGIVREVVVLPLSYLLYAIRILTITTPEMYFWGVLVFILGVAAFRSLARKRTVYFQPQLSELAELAHASSANGRVVFWAQKVNLMRRGASRYYTTNFHSIYGRLLLNVLAHRYRLTLREVEDRLHEGTIDVPDEVREYALFALQRAEVQSYGYLRRLWQNLLDGLKRWFSFRPADSDPSTSDDPRVIAILKYIEDELEVSHVDSGR